MATTKTQQKKSRTVVDKKAWARLSVHTVTCPSGAIVKIRLPDLSMLLAGDAVPDRLRGAALMKIMDEVRTPDEQVENGAGPERDTEKDMELLKDLADLHLWLVSMTLLEPSYSLEELQDPEQQPPADDMLFLTQLATRERNTDAAGVRLGVEPLSRWETFRHHHGCDEACYACKKVVADFSTTRMDAM